MHFLNLELSRNQFTCIPFFDNEPYIKLIKLAFFIMDFPPSSVEPEDCLRHVGLLSSEIESDFVPSEA